MAVKRNGLGKGLDSLIPNKNENKPKTSAKSDTKTKKEEEVIKTGEIMVKINQVEPNRDQPRKDFDEDALVELADSIKQFGILQPLIVQKKKDYYELIAGERRWRASPESMASLWTRYASSTEYARLCAYVPDRYSDTLNP